MIFRNDTSRLLALMGLLFVLLPMCGCGMFSNETDYERFQRKETNFIRDIVAAGGTAKKEYKTLSGFGKVGWCIDLSHVKITDRMIAQIIAVGKLDPVFQLNLSDSKITDDQLTKLDDGRALERTFELDLSNTQITDAGLDMLSNVCWISILNIKGSKVTTEGAKRLGDKKIANPDTPPFFKKQPEVKA